MNPSSRKHHEIKCIVWDLDNTLWEGILLENDDVQLRPGIRKIIQDLDNRGILHSIASRNDYGFATAKLEEFGLLDYFLYPEINWDAKSESISRIQKNLNIAMAALMFIDDSPFERDEVEHAYPEVVCVDSANLETLLDDARLIPRFITGDSRKRRFMYKQNIERKNLEDSYKGPRGDFLAELKMRFTISPAVEDDLQRAEELTVRTNQLNTTGKVYGYSELHALINSPNHQLLVADLTDKYGSHGKIGLALIEEKAESWHLHLFLMSCRVMSYGVGSVFLTHILSKAKRAGKRLLVDFIQTDRNRMLYITFKFTNFKEIETGNDGYVLLENDLSVIQDMPSHLELIIK